MSHLIFRGHPLFQGVHRAAGIGAIVVGLTVAVGGCGDQSVSADAHVAKAEAQIAGGDLRAGVIELKNAIQQNPEDPEARLLLGTTYLVLGDPASAEKELARARELGAAAQDVLIPLARAWNDQGAYEKTLKHLVDDDIVPGQHRIDVLVVRGQAHLGLGQLAAAQAHFDEALAGMPDDVPALIGRARLAMQQDDPEAAESLVGRAKRLAPEDAEVLAAAGTLALGAGRPAEAVAAFGKLAERVPGNFGYTLSLAQAMIANDQADAAVGILDGLLRRAPEHPHAHYLRALAAYHTKDFEAAKAHGQKVLDAVPNHLGSLLIVGGAHFAVGENEQAAARLQSFVRSVPQHEPARRVLGEALLKVGDPAGAQRILRPLVDHKDNKDNTDIDDAGLLAMIGTAALRSGDLESSKRYFERLAETQPENAAARAQLGVIRLDLGEIEDGIADLEKSVGQDPDGRALALLATSYMRMGLLDKALEVAQRLTHAQADSAIGPTLAGIIHVWRNEADQARVAFQRARAVDPDAPGAGLNLAALDFRQGKPESAHQILVETLEKNPRNPQVLQRLGALEALTGRPAAKSRFVELIAIEPDNVQLKASLAQLHLQDGEPQKALDLTERLLRSNPGDIQLGGVVGRAYLTLGRPQDAEKVFRSLSETHPDAVAPRLALAQALVAGGEQGQAKEQLEKVLQIEPENVPAGLALARLAGAEGDLERAERLLAAFDDTAADNPDVLELRGDVAAAAGRLDDADRFYRRVLQRDPTGVRSIKLATVERRAGNPDYLSTLQVWLADHPDDVAVRLAMADARLAAQDNAAAREEYERIVAIAPENVVARNNLAWLLWQDGDVSAALPHITTALELAPESPQVQDTAGTVLLAAGNAERAVVLLRKAAEASPENPTIRYHLAQALHAIGESGQARHVLEQVLGNASPFPERQQAEIFLTQLDG